MNAPAPHDAPAFEVTGWRDADGPVSPPSLCGQVVAVYAFKMLCPVCVAHALPQARQLEQRFGGTLAVLGLHTVFEHHEAMSEHALAAFLHEYRIGFPVGIDRPGTDGPVPRTMRRYRTRGPPTLLLLDRQGVLRHSLFGYLPDLQVGALVGALLAEPGPDPGCGDVACPLPGGR